MFTTLDENGSELDMYELNRMMDKTKTSVFLGQHSAFLGSIMCSMNFIWAEDVPTAATDAVNIWWNPHWFLKLDPLVRKTVLAHELWHVARLHFLRVGSRNHEYWNYACDIAINNDLENQGFSFVGTQPWKDQTYGNQPEEDIYDALMANNIVMPPPPWGGTSSGEPDPSQVGDMIPVSDGNKQQAINNVVAAIHQSKLAGQAGHLPGNIEKVLKQFLQPIIQWEILLHRFFSDLLDENVTWSRPNRRYTDMYLPSKFTDDGRLAKLNYYMDVSGSVSDSDVLRFNSEVKHVKDTYNPEEMNLVQFDTRITSETRITESDQFNEIKIVGRGGTALEPVRQHINEHKPTAAIIFSDLFCTPMAPLDFDIPIIWVAVGNRSATVPFGQLIHIKGS